MPHIRKPSKINSQLNNNDNTKVFDSEIKSKAEKTISKVDQSKRNIISFDGSNDDGKGKRDESVTEVTCKKCDNNELVLKSVCDKKNKDKNNYGKVSEVISKKLEGCAKNVEGRKGSRNVSDVTETAKNIENTTLFVTSVENYPGKEKKVKFVDELKHSDNSTGFRKPYHGSKSDKQKTFYPNFKSDNKNILPLPQPPELYVPQVGEIAVITDLVPDDPISACLPCLEANGTYICTPCNPRCFIIQKVTTSPTGSVTTAAPSPPPPPPPSSAVSLNPDADVFEGTRESSVDSVRASKSDEENCSSVTGNANALGSTVDTPCSEITDPPWAAAANPDYIPQESYAYMNGDVGKLPSGVVYTSTPDPLASSNTDYSTLNGIADAIDHLEGREGAGAPPPVSSPPSGGTQDTNGIPLEQLKQMLSSQLEYYFSRENLANDAYLISQMDNDQYVPIWTVANFNQVKKLTTDIKLITEVLRESPNVQVDEEGQKVRPNHKRCIVILREIPDSTPLEDVKNLFSGENCPRLISCEFAHNNSWYVTFESDEDAQRAYRFLREEVKEFQGKPIMARIKAKPMNRLPLPPVGGGGLGPMKNGYRTPPVAYDPNAGTFQPPPPNPGAQQRFLYTNGSSIPPTVNYGNQVHVYTFQQPNQPFYPPTMLQPWGAANTYFDIGSVFSVNGLAPQQSFAKPSNARFVPRTSRGSKRPQVNERNTMPDGNSSAMPRQHHMTVGMGPVAVAMTSTVPVVAKTMSNPTTVKVQPIPVVEHNHSKSQPHSHSPNVVHIHPHSVNESLDVVSSRLSSEPQDSLYRQNKDNKSEPNSASFNADRHRRRRKEEEAVNASQPQQQNSTRANASVTPNSCKQGLPPSSSPQPPIGPGQGQNQGQFDLEANAFPPLPGIEAGTGTVVKTVPVEVVTPPETNSQSHWGENRLADVVKGTVKVKSTSSTKEKDEGGSNSPRPSSPVTPQTPLPVVKSASTGTNAVDVQEKPSRTAQASSQTSRAEQPTITTTSQSQQTTLISEPVASKNENKEIALISCDASVATSTNILTPPPSPIKSLVPLVKCMTADKSTKTDDILLNGEPEKAESQTTLSKPSTTNVATMTSSIAIETDFPISNSNSNNNNCSSSSSSNNNNNSNNNSNNNNDNNGSSGSSTNSNGGNNSSTGNLSNNNNNHNNNNHNNNNSNSSNNNNSSSSNYNNSNNNISNNNNNSQNELPPRLSYAQVTQHHHKEKAEKISREKHNSESEREKERKKEPNHPREVREKKESGEGFREVTSRSSGRTTSARQSQGLDRHGPRRRELQQSDRVPRSRDQPRPRSPK